VPPPAPRTPRASIPLPKSVAPKGDDDTVGAAPAVTARASVRPPSQPPRSALVWQPARALAAEQLSARLLVLPLFQEIDPEARRRYAREASMLTFRAGEVMVAAPEPGERAVESALLVLTEGTAVTAVPGDDVPIALLGPGDVAGELGALHGGIPVAETVARTEVKAVSFAPSLVRAMARSHGSVRQSLDETAWERAFASLGRGARLLRRIDAAERAKVFSWFEPVEIEEGALLLSEGAAPSALWLLAAGEVEVYGGALEGIWRARAGEALGLVALLDDAAAGVTARAVRRALAAKLPASKFKEMLKHHPSLAGARDDLGVVC
jgi:CRP-like cAMP-binding protein